MIAPHRNNKILLGDEFRLLDTGELASLTQSQLNMYVNELRTRIADMQYRVSSHDCGGGTICDEAALEGFRQAIINYQSHLAAVIDFINNPGGTNVEQQQQQYQNSYNNAIDYATNNAGTDIFAELKKNYAGIPLWGWLAGGGALWYGLS